jgi:hypothetical protein
MLPSLSLQTPLLHIVLLRRNCSAEELSAMSMFDRLLAASELLCGGNVVSLHDQTTITSCHPPSGWESILLQSQPTDVETKLLSHSVITCLRDR